MCVVNSEMSSWLVAIFVVVINCAVTYAHLVAKLYYIE